MTKLLEEAVEEVRDLPEDEQDRVAQALITFFARLAGLPARVRLDQQAKKKAPSKTATAPREIHSFRRVGVNSEKINN